MKTWTTISALLLIFTGCSQTATFRATVDAGPSHRLSTPVFAEVKLSEAQAERSAWVSFDDQCKPAQIESLGEDKARIWWMVCDLPAGKKRTYTITIGKKAPAEQPPVFTWKDSSDAGSKSIDLIYAGRPVFRYMYTPFNRKDVESTKKVFHQVFDPNGSREITKGLGGKFPHHRGIFFGYMKCFVGKQVHDTWHAAHGPQVHKEFVREVTGPIFGGHVLKINWNDRRGKPFIEETRSLFAYRQPQDEILIEFTTKLRTLVGPVKLDGDRQHGGVQFRAAQEVADNQEATRYLRPAKWSSLPPDEQINTPEHKDLPWNAIKYSIGDRAYTVAYLTDPKNPDNAEFSERLYGRFGEFIRWQLREDNPLELRYRWWIKASDAVTREEVKQRYQDLANPPKVVLE